MTKTKSSRQLAGTWPYKRSKDYEAYLRKAAGDWFINRGYETHPRRGYCLARHEDWTQNIICGDVAEYILQERKRCIGKESFPLHKFLHHGLSSQAMAFNLIGPLIARKDLAPLKIALEKQGVNWPDGEVEAVFELDDRSVFNEDRGQPTSIDISFKGVRNSVFIEAKLVERGFGGCSVFAGGDCNGANPFPDGLDGCYLHHIGRKYWQRFDEFGFTEAEIGKGPICPFANYYQFFREVLFAFAKGGSFVLLHDERNTAFLRSADSMSNGGLWSFLCESIPLDLRNKVGSLTIQNVVQAIEESGRHDNWIRDFRNKYGLY